MKNIRNTGLNSRLCRLLVYATLSVTVCTAFVLSNNGCQARSQSNNGREGRKELLGNVPGISQVVANTEMKDGAAFVQKWYETADSLADYSFTYQMTVFKGSGEQTEQGSLYFKKPRLMRIEVTNGPKSGAVAVLQKDGKVRAHMGGGLKLFTVTLSPDSSLLRSLNGWPMVDSDFLSLAVAIKQYLKEGCTAKVSENPTVQGNNHNKLHVMEVYRNSGELYKRALFDPQTTQPVEWWDYKDGKLFAHSVWSDFRPNSSLSDKVFTMKGDK